MRFDPSEGLIFGRYDYRRTLRKWAGVVLGEERARYLTLRDLRHAALTDLAEVTQSVGAVAAVAGHRDLRTTSRYFNAHKRAATAALRARSEADRQLESGRITGTITGTRLSGRSAEIILLRKNRDGRVAQLDRALPSGGIGHRFESCRVRCDLNELAVWRRGMDAETGANGCPESVAKEGWDPCRVLPPGGSCLRGTVPSFARRVKRTTTFRLRSRLTNSISAKDIRFP